MHVYWLEQCAADVPPDDAWLSAREVACVDGMRFAQRRADWRLGRWTAKCAVAACHDPSAPGEIEIRAAPSGAPEVFIENQPAPVTISLSHRDKRAICAVARFGTAVGCDLEVIEPHSDAFVADYFTARERWWVARTTGSDRDRLVALIWSAKESALKALRVGLRVDTREIVVSGLDAAMAGHGRAWCDFKVAADKWAFDGWWQQTGQFIRTVVAPAGTLAPIGLQVAFHPPGK